MRPHHLRPTGYPDIVFNMQTASIDGIELLEPLRKTSSAVTWKALQQALSRVVAVKILNPEVAADRHQHNRLLEVARAIARIKHPNLIQIYDVVHRPPEAPYLIHEFVDGPSLADLLERQRPLPVARALSAAFGVAEGLGAMWRQARIIHRNIKPSEICFDADGTPKIADIGMAAPAWGSNAGLPSETAVVGTPNYLSPEQARGDRHLDCRTDMYALGATLYHVLTGHVPFGDLEPVMALRCQLHDQLPHPRTLNPDLAPDLCVFLQRLMMKAPDARFDNWEAVAQEIQHLMTRRVPRAGLRSPSGESTIGAAPANRKPASPADTPHAEPAPQAPARPLPYMLRHTLWTLLLLWLVVLGRWRWQNTRPATPADAPVAQMPSSASTDTAASPDPAPSVSPTSRPTDTAPLPSLAQRLASASIELDSPAEAELPPPADDVPEQPTGMDDPFGAFPAPDREPFVEAVRDPFPEAEAPAPPSPLESLADALLALDFSRARALAAQADDDGDLHQALQALPHPDEQVETGIMAHLGMPIGIDHNDQQLTLVPTRQVGNEIFADIITNGRRQPTRFTVGQLNATERARLAAPPQTPAEHAAQALLYLSDGNTEAAARLAEACGALAPVIGKAIARIEAAQQ